MDCAGKLVKSEGAGALFKGLPPALLRQSTYGSLRYGLYGPIRNSLGVKPGTPKHEIPLSKKILAGAGAGALSSAVANPTDLVKVRLQTDGQFKGPDGAYLPKKYTGMGHAFSSIVKEEGVLGLWKGVGPTCSRATRRASRPSTTGWWTASSRARPRRGPCPCTTASGRTSAAWCLASPSSSS